MPGYSELFVNRRIGIQQQRRDVFDLLFGQDAAVSEAWHVCTSRVRLGVVYLAKGVLLNGLGIAAQLAEVV